MSFEEHEGNDSTEAATGLLVLAELLDEFREKLDPKIDLEPVAGISLYVNEKEKRLEEDLEAQRAQLEGMYAELDRAKEAAQRPAGTPSAEEHEATVHRLTQEQYAARKLLNEEEAQTSRCDGELARLRAEREEVRQLRVEDKGENHAQVLRLGLFAGMGFSVLDEKPAKILVRNDGKNDVHTVTVLDAAKKVHYANLLWDLAS